MKKDKSEIDPKKLIGSTVSWTSQAGGYEKQKTGVVVALLPKGRSAYALVPSDGRNEHGQINMASTKFQNHNFNNDRYLVRVPRGGKSTRNDYYAPRVGQVLRVADNLIQEDLQKSEPVYIGIDIASPGSKDQSVIQHYVGGELVFEERQ